MTKRLQIPPEERNRLIKLIHIAKKQLRLDDDDYRAILNAETGKTSCAEMTWQQLNKVHNRMIQLGFQPGEPKSSKGKQVLSPTYGKTSQEGKLVALWINAFKLKLIKDRSHEALCNYVWAGQQEVAILPGVDRLKAAPWKLKQDRIQGLEEMIKRAKAKEAGGEQSG